VSHTISDIECQIMAWPWSLG